MSRSRGIAITGLIVGSGIALMSYLPTWVSAARGEPGLPQLTGTFTGRQVAPTAAALALAVLAGSVAVWALRGGWVRAVGVVLLGASGYLVVAPIAFAADPTGRLTEVFPLAAGSAGTSHFKSAEVTLWWIAALLGGLIALVASFIVVFHRGRWGGISARYERAGTDTGPTDLSAPRAGAAAWDALDRGDDPTLPPPVASAEQAPTASPGATDGT